MKKKLLLIASLLALSACGGGGGGSSSPSAEPSAEPSASSSEEEEVYELLSSPTADYPTFTGTSATGVNYEIFVYSFADSNGDGIGDLKGIEGKLDYLKELGVENLWLTPIHPSSTYHKYNVRDYFSIDSDFGTMADFESLVSKAKAKGIGIIMDMVLNHSGKDNPMFSAAVSDFVNNNTSTGTLKDLYVLSLSMDDPRFARKKLVSSVSHGGKTVFYECNFDTQMPEFNIEADVTKAKHKEILDFWLDKGVAGFRFDGVAYYELNNEAKNREYTTYLANTVKAKKADAALIAEYWVSDADALRKMTKSGMSVFNFEGSVSSATQNPIVAQNMGNGRKCAVTAESMMKGCLEESEGKVLPSFFISNHDQDRWYQQAKTPERAKGVASTYLLTPGTPYVYYGEEIGLQGIRLTSPTDGNRRLPMQWVANASSDSARCRPEPAADYSGKQTELGALEAIQDANSLTSWYKKVIAFRNAHPEIQKGTFVNLTPQSSPFVAFEIRYNGAKTVLIHSVFEEKVKIDLGKAMGLDSTLCGSETKLNGTVLTLAPYETAYLSIQN